ncbi:shikimate dehydrogenase [Lysobacter korlensis]|uniref:Shikimate dehydrogenase (NADP(+)) n=1 Tax=Lysobacter korlensis TaxID=553636 RepID=A0ABV6RHQ1_9GAMM
MKRYAVFGHPVAHSRSPRIHAAFAAQCAIELEYTKIDASPDAFAGAVAAFGRAGGLGANVTLPHKLAAAALCEQVSDRARRAGAVNTLVRASNAWHGDNTDGVGLVRDLQARHGLDLHGRRTLIIGAGGAARGVAPALLDAGIGALVVANRTPASARTLLDAIDAPASARACGLDSLPMLGAFDLVINATAAARGDGLVALPASLVHTGSAAVDLGYGAAAAAFLDWARDAGAGVQVDGLGMLVEQAAESFMRWHGIRPNTDPVYAMLRADDGG